MTQILFQPYFCGQASDCIRSDTRLPLERAKRVIDKQFAAVGVTERLEDSIRVFEAKLPQFFTGAYDYFFADKDSASK